MERIDRQKVRADLAARVLFVKELKRSKREPHQPNWSGEKDRMLLGWQVQLTLLYMLLAQSRGRLHLHKWGDQIYDIEEQEKVVLALASKYSLPAAA